MSPSNQKERASVAEPLTLSPRMHNLLATIMHAIDRRVDLINEAIESDPEYEPDTCDCCGGTGLVMVQPARVDRSGDGAKSIGALSSRRDTVPRRNSDNSDVGNYTEEMRSMLGMPPAQDVTGPSGAGSAGANQAPGGSGAQTGTSAVPLATSSATTSGVVPMTVTPAIPAPPVTVFASAPPVMSAPAVTVSTAVPPVAPPVAVPTAVAPPIAVVTAPPSAPVGTQGHHFGPFGPVPAPSTVTPGSHPLGPNTPVPDPQNAVFATAGGDRYYAVTMGRRVGVFSGWLNMCSYVQRVPSAAYSKHNDIAAAYDAYCEAHANQLVRYI